MFSPHSPFAILRCARRAGARDIQRGARRGLCLLIGLVLLGRTVSADEMTYWYDDVGRLKRVMDQYGGIRTYQYDPVGNILSIEAGSGGCPAVPPTSIGITPTSCRAGTTCHLSFVGSSLMGGAVGSSLLGAAITHCREADCGTITCRLAPDPFLPAGPLTVTVTTPLGTTQQTIQLEEPSRLGAGGGEDAWYFVGEEGQVITLAMTRIVNQNDGSSTLDPMVELRDSRGVLLTRDDDSGTELPPGPGRNAVIQSYRLPATDTFRVVAKGRGGTLGAYVLDIEPPPITLIPGPGPETRQPAFVFEGSVVVRPLPGVPVATFQGEIATPTERDVFTFPANRGTVVSVQVARRPNRSNGSGSLDPAVELRDSRGFLLRRDNNGGSNLPPGNGQNALIANHELLATDTYRIVVVGADGTTGPYEVKIVVGAVTVETQPGSFTIPANAGVFATIIAERRPASASGSAALDPRIELRDSRGFLLASDDDGWTNQPPGPGRNAIVARTYLPATDTYRLTVRGSNGTVGPFRAEVFFVD